MARTASSRLFLCMTTTCHRTWSRARIAYKVYILYFGSRTRTYYTYYITRTIHIAYYVLYLSAPANVYEFTHENDLCCYTTLRTLFLNFAYFLRILAPITAWIRVRNFSSVQRPCFRRGEATQQLTTRQKLSPEISAHSLSHKQPEQYRHSRHVLISTFWHP